MSIAVILITHNAEKFLPKAMDGLQKQTLLPSQIILIDSGSKDTGYLLSYRKWKNVHLHIEEKDIGFCAGNNLGMDFLDTEIEFVHFLNPDAFLETDFYEKATLAMKEHPKAGVITGPLYSFDIDQNAPRGTYDSTGIFQTWYGKWYDRAQGQMIKNEEFAHIERLPAICGASMFCRKSALESIRLSQGAVFDPSFYMYKEDIDLSLRLTKNGWDLLFIPTIRAYHCRGWNRKRREVPRKYRLLSACNELRIIRKNPSSSIFYSLLKYSLVKLCDL